LFVFFVSFSFFVAFSAKKFSRQTISLSAGITTYFYVLWISLFLRCFFSDPATSLFLQIFFLSFQNLRYFLSALKYLFLFPKSPLILRGRFTPFSPFPFPPQFPTTFLSLAFPPLLDPPLRISWRSRFLNCREEACSRFFFLKFPASSGCLLLRLLKLLLLTCRRSCDQTPGVALSEKVFFCFATAAFLLFFFSYFLSRCFLRPVFLALQISFASFAASKGDVNLFLFSLEPVSACVFRPLPASPNSFFPSIRKLFQPVQVRPSSN